MLLNAMLKGREGCHGGPRFRSAGSVLLFNTWVSCGPWYVVSVGLFVGTAFVMTVCVIFFVSVYGNLLFLVFSLVAILPFYY